MVNRHVITHILIAIFTGILMYSGFRSLLDVSDTILIVYALVSGTIFSSLFIPLRYVLRYNHFSSFEAKQRFINYSALVILFVTCWVGLEYLILYTLFPAGQYEPFMPLLPTRVIQGCLVCCLAISLYSHANTGDNQEDAPVEDEKAENQDITADVPANESTKVVLERIVVKNGQKIEVIPVSDIVYLQAEGDYVMIHSTKGRFLKEQTMKSFENELPSNKFVRIHRSSIINVDFIASIELYEKQSQILKLKNGAQVKISQSGYRTLKAVLGL